MPKSLKKRVALSQDAIFFLSKLFPWIMPDCKERLCVVDLKGKTLTHRAMEASCECIEAGFLAIENDIYYRLKSFQAPPLKLQRIREAYEAFDIFASKASETRVELPSKDLDFVPLIQTLTDLSRIQGDVLNALGYKDLTDPVAQLHVLHAIQAIQRLSVEGVKGLETVLERRD